MHPMADLAQGLLRKMPKAVRPQGTGCLLVLLVVTNLSSYLSDSFLEEGCPWRQVFC